MANTMPDSKGTFTGNTFLGVRPGTITKETSRAKAKRNLRAARARRDYIAAESFLRANNAKVVNSVINSNTNAGQYGRTGSQAFNALNKIIPKAYDYSALAKMNAKRDLATDYTSQQFYAKYGLDQTTHNYFIQQGNKWMTDQKALEDWIMSDYETAPDKQGEYEEYMRKYLKSVKTYNSDGNVWGTEQQFTEDAPLPPWITPTAMNLRMWEYYKTYAHDVVQAAADSFVEKREEQKEYALAPYKSAFSSRRDENDIDSFFDLIISPGDDKTVIDNTVNYFRDYYINPIKNGKFLTVAGNAVWNLMDTMDLAARGVRAFTAGEMALGGARTFRGQQEYWAKIGNYDEETSRRLQERFMQNGGYELLRLDKPGAFTGYTARDRDEFIQQLNKEFNGNGWQIIYDALLNSDYFNRSAVDDLKQGVENVKQAYSDPSATFNAETDSLAANVLIEVALDPGLVLGGMAKSIAKSTVRDAATTAVRDGFEMLLKDSDDAVMLLKNKRVRRAISEFIRSNEGRNIIFKDSKKFGEDVSVFIKRLDKEIPGLFTDGAEKKAFGDIISAHLFSKNKNINTAIIESTGWARNAIDTKTFKAAYYMDHAIDSIDSAIIKSSFAAPWGLVKGLKFGKKFVLDNTAVGKMYYAKKLMKAEAARTVRNELTNAVDVTSFPDLLAKYNSNQLDEESFKAGLREIVKAYDNTTRSIPRLTKQFGDGKITAEEVYRIISDQIKQITGGKYSSVDELIAQVEGYEVRYAGDLGVAYDRLKRSFDLLEKTIYRQSDAAVADFLTEVSHTTDIDSLRRLFRDNMDNSVIMGLRTEVTDRALFDVSVDDIEKIVADLKTGMFSDVPVSEANIQRAVRHVEHASTDVVKRTVNLRDVQKLIKHNYSYLLDSSDSYVSKLKPLFDLKPGGAKEVSLDYAIDCIESAKRSLMTSEHIKSHTILPGTAGLIHRDPRMADLRRLKDTIRGLDIVSLKDNEVITIMHIDRMAMFRKFAEDPSIAKVYGNDFDNIIAPALDILESRSLDDIDLATDTFVQDLLRMRELKYGHDRTEMLISELKTLHTLSDKKLHSVLNGLGNNFGRAHGTLVDTLSNPEILRRNLEVTTRTQFGVPKLGNAGMTDILKSVDTDAPSEFLAPYIKEFDDPVKGSALKAKYDSIANASSLEHGAYVKKQMLLSLIMDPSIVDDYNALAKKGNTPIFYHINTSGLNNEINEITSISCIKWSNIEVSKESPLTLEKILDAIPDEPTVFKQGMSDAQIDGISENVLRRMDMKGLSSSQLRDSVRGLYRAANEGSMRSERDVIEDFCKYIQDESILHVGKRGADAMSVPTLVVHDLDGFNIPYFNKRVALISRDAPASSSTQAYIKSFSKRIQDASANTYTRLAEKVDDSSFSEDEINHIVDMLKAYADDINRYAGNNFDPFDYEEFGRTFERVLYESTSPVNDSISDLRSAIVNASSTSVVDMEAYKHTMQNITELSRYPKQYAFVSQAADENAVSVALRAVGKDSVNVESRVYVKDVMSFFDVADSTTGQLSSNIPALQRMHNISQYVIRNRDRNIASTALDLLTPYKTQFDTIIDTVRRIGTGYSSGSEYSFLAHIRTPDNVVDSYLLSQKLYDDYIKYWCFGDTANAFADDVENLNALKQRLDSFYTDTHNAIGDLYNTTKELSSERMDAFKSGYKEYKASRKEQFRSTLNDVWGKYRSEKAANKEAYTELNSELWDAYAKQSDLAGDLLAKAKKTTAQLWDEYRVDKEYAQYLKQEAKERSAHLFDDYHARKAELDELYKSLKGETERVVNSWKASKEFKNPPRTIEKLRTRTQKVVKASVKDVLKDTSLKRNEISEVVKQYDEVSRRAVSLLIDNKTSEAGELIYNTVSDTVKGLTRVDDAAYKESEAFRRYLRTSAIDPSDTIKKDITDFNSFRKRNFGSIKFRKGGTDYDKFLLELEELFPEYLGDEAFEGPSGLFTHLEEKLSSLKPKTVAIPDDEQVYLIDKLSNDLFDMLQEEADALRFKQLSFDDIMYKPLDTSGLEYFDSYKQYRDAFNKIDWNSYKQAKAALSRYRKQLLEVQEGFYKDYLDQLSMMKSKYDLSAMSARTEEVWSAFNDAAYTKWLQGHWTREQSAELRAMFSATTDILLHEAKADADELYQAYIDSISAFRTTEYDKAISDINVLWEMYHHNKNELLTLFKDNPDRLEASQDFFDSLMDYFNKYKYRVFDDFTNRNFGLGFDRFRSEEFEDVFRILDGEFRPEIFKSEARSDYFKTVYSYREGTMREGIDMATRLSEANSTITSSLRQLDSIDRYYINAGINTKTDRALGMLHMNAKTLYDMLDATDISRRPSFQRFIKEASEAQQLRVQQHALDLLKVDGQFNRKALISELLYNNFNHICFNSHAYSVDDMQELRAFVKDLQSNGDDFLSYYEDRSTGNIFVYLNYNAEVSTDGARRWLNRTEVFEKPVRRSIGFTDFDELKTALDLDDIEDFRSIYEHIKACWDDTRIISRGEINGTSGRVVTRTQAERYLNSLPSALNDMVSPKGLLVSDTAKGVIYDPGFVIDQDTDILLDFLSTLHLQSNVAKEDAILINEMCGTQAHLKFNDLAKHFSDEELMEYFGKSSDYVVVTISPNSSTRTGLQIRALKVDSLAGVRAARELPNTTILPYDMYYEVSNIMNRTEEVGIYRRILGKYMQVYKAFALGTKPGTWMRNYIDATRKAALDGGEDLLTGTASLVSYHGKAVRDISTYYKIMKADPSLITEGNWRMVQSVFGTDMPYEDFLLLKGIVDSDHIYSADKYFLKKTAMKRGGLEVISGENIGIRNLEEVDIKKVFEKYLAKESDLPLTKDEFLDIYLHRVEVTPETNDLYEDMMRRLSQNLRTADKTNIFDKTINNMFKPFAYTENITRYSQSLYLRDMGFSGNQSLRHIHQTQFYNAPQWGAFHTLETIMPFVTFKYNNIMYWIRMMDENPRYFRYFEELYGNIAEDTIEDYLEQGNEIDYESDNAFQTGGIPAGINGVYFNVGNSFLSAMNDYYGVTSNFNQLNPLLRETLRYSAYALGLNSKEFLSELDLDVSDESPERNMLKMLPGYSVGNQAVRLFKNIPNTCDANGGPTMDTLFATLAFLGPIGIRRTYSNSRASDFVSWQAELAEQGKWFDANTGKIVDISLKNDYGANNPNLSFEDIQAYMMIHFHKIWDANTHKFVELPEDLQLPDFDFENDPQVWTELKQYMLEHPDGLLSSDFFTGLNQKFDFDNDPDAWDKLQAFMLKYHGKVYDYNLRKFVLESELSPGGLNDPDISWEKKQQLMEEKFGLKWDANQNVFVTPDKYISGGLNQFFDFKNDRSAWSRLQSLRLALYGETYDKSKKEFVKTSEPQIVVLRNPKEQKELDNYFSRLGIPRIEIANDKLSINSEGFLVTSKGQYVLTDNVEYNSKVFDKLSGQISTYSRGYNGHKRRSYSKLYNRSKKPYKGRTLGTTYYTGYGWNDREGYYRFQYNYNYQYHNPQPGRKLHRLLSPRITYPYGGGYNKYSFYMR